MEVPGREIRLPGEESPRIGPTIFGAGSGESTHPTAAREGDTITRGGRYDYPGRKIRLPGEGDTITRGGRYDYPGRKIRLPGEGDTITRGGRYDYPGRKIRLPGEESCRKSLARL